MDLGLKGKVAIVTGGALGIGAGIVEGFAKEGANVVVADINLDAGQELAKKIRKTGVKGLAVKVDVSKKTDADRLVATVLKEFGKIDILVNNAGICRFVNFVDIKEEEWERVHDINVKGVYLVTRAVIPHMIRVKRGNIVNISSILGKWGRAGLNHYVASKFAVIGMTQSLANEFAEHDINVNAVCPGIVHTPLWEGLLDTLCESDGRPRDSIFASWLAQVPLRRAQSPEDIANVVLFLCSEVSRNITGESINVNGGWRMD